MFQYAQTQTLSKTNGSYTNWRLHHYSILGSFFANGRNNDASILKYMVKSNDENLLQWFKKDDIIILDRGFRDSIEFLNDIGFCTKFPAFLGPKEKQFSAN